jgi:hypothetical protein
MTRKHYLVVGASALALTSFTAPAGAFDVVHWEWWKIVDEHIDKDVRIRIDIEPTGLVELENLQIFIGDLTATSYVYDIYNRPPAGGDGTVDLGTLHLETDYALGGGFLNNGYQICTNNDGITDCTPFTGQVIETDLDRDGDGMFEVNGTVIADIPLGTVQVTPEGALDALTELPEVVSTATAVANNSSVTSTVAVEMHEGQFAFDTCRECGETGVGIDGLYGITGNTHTNLALALTYAASFGWIAPADITATSWVFNILNATVNSTATAVANNKSITIDPATPDDALLIADITQFAFANVAAYSQVTGVTVNNYTNLGMLDYPLVNSVATAVGNNLNITVGPVAP